MEMRMRSAAWSYRRRPCGNRLRRADHPGRGCRRLTADRLIVEMSGPQPPRARLETRRSCVPVSSTRKAPLGSRDGMARMGAGVLPCESTRRELAAGSPRGGHQGVRNSAISGADARQNLTWAQERGTAARSPTGLMRVVSVLERWTRCRLLDSAPRRARRRQRRSVDSASGDTAPMLPCHPRLPRELSSSRRLGRTCGSSRAGAAAAAARTSQR